MDLRFIGIDPNTGDDECPTVWVDNDAQEIVIQGWKAGPEMVDKISDTQWVAGHKTGIPDTEGVFRLPARMVPALREACDAVERAQLR
ncbi:hypothetical protein [Streptacidiphilus sp. MAP5-3]|uniref:hypothetical protein n=1 Tax=unclassified Streptacidiphilus TaxID=2643834 RepID=UPI00351701A0